MKFQIYQVLQSLINRKKMDRVSLRTATYNWCMSKLYDFENVMATYVEPTYAIFAAIHAIPYKEDI